MHWFNALVLRAMVVDSGGESCGQPLDNLQDHLPTQATWAYRGGGDVGGPVDTRRQETLSTVPPTS